MDLKDYPHYFLYVMLIYFFMLAYGIDFLLSSVNYGILEGTEALIVSLIVILPAALLALYATKGRFLVLYTHRNTLRAACTAAMIVSLAFVALLILPLTF